VLLDDLAARKREHLIGPFIWPLSKANTIWGNMESEPPSSESFDDADRIARKSAMFADPGQALGFTTHNDNKPPSAPTLDERGDVGPFLFEAHQLSCYHLQVLFGNPLPYSSAEEPKEWLVTFDPEGVVRVSEWWLPDPESTMPGEELRTTDYGRTWYATSNSEAALRRFEEVLTTFRELVFE